MAIIISYMKRLPCITLNISFISMDFFKTYPDYIFILNIIIKNPVLSMQKLEPFITLK